MCLEARYRGSKAVPEGPLDRRRDRRPALAVRADDGQGGTGLGSALDRVEPSSARQGQYALDGLVHRELARVDDRPALTQPPCLDFVQHGDGLGQEVGGGVAT